MKNSCMTKIGTILNVATNCKTALIRMVGSYRDSLYFLMMVYLMILVSAVVNVLHMFITYEVSPVSLRLLASQMILIFGLNWIVNTWEETE